MTTPHTHSPTLLKPTKPVGIIGYGATSPLSLREMARVREYHGRSTEQVAEIFKQVGLKSDFWYIQR